MKNVDLFIVTSSQGYVNQALTELRSLDAGLKVIMNLGNGIMIVEPTIDKRHYNDIIVRYKPIFVRHINSVDYILEIDSNTTVGEVVSSAEHFKDSILPGDKIAVRVRKAEGSYIFSPLELKNGFDKYIEEELEAKAEIKSPDKIISVLLNDNRLYIGLSATEDNLSSWSGGMVHYKKDEGDISRAKFKLMEAINVFDIDLSGVDSALDLGAAPGGWTSVLLERGIGVTAVDTGDMDSRLNKYDNYRFIKSNVSEVILEHESFDMLTSDISWNPINTARMIAKCSEYLRKNGLAVVTVKLMGSKVSRTIKEVKAIYEEVFDILAAKQLFHNRDEITMYMKKR